MMSSSSSSAQFLLGVLLLVVWGLSSSSIRHHYCHAFTVATSPRRRTARVVLNRKDYSSVDRPTTVLFATTTKRQDDDNNGMYNYYYGPRRPQRRRRPIIAGNWKLNPASRADSMNLLKLLHANFCHQRNNNNAEVEVVVFPPALFLADALAQLEGSGIKVGAQHVSLVDRKGGAYTGEISAAQIRSMGVDYVMVGHSERRILYMESDDDVNQKVKLCLAEPGLHVIICVGETLDEYESDLLQSVCDLQVRKALRNVVDHDQLDRIVIAYEPVWAIGTGRVATPLQAQQAHEVIRSTLLQMYGSELAESVRIQYGGSVKADNAVEILQMADVDGALVGGASLSADSFTRIVDAAAAVVLDNDDGPKTSSSSSFRPHEFTAREVVPCQNVLGESAVWSTRDQTLYWISAPEEEVWAWNVRGNAPAYRRLTGTALGCVAVASGPPGTVVLAGERAFLKVQMRADSGDFSTGPTVLCERPEQDDVTRPNDGRVDRQGRLVFGMYNNYHRKSVGAANTCGLYRLTPDLKVESLLPDDDSSLRYRVSNCICFPSSGDTMFFCDTPTRKIYQFDYPAAATGTKAGGGLENSRLSNRRCVWTMPPHWPGGPDGAQVDDAGYLWAAISGAGRVVRIDPKTGIVDCIVHLPVTCPTSCTFGGPDLDELFITTRGPDGGGIYRLKMPFGIKGLPEPEFQIDNNKNATS
jgi:triosephosphate isomerase (TIM)